MSALLLAAVAVLVLVSSLLTVAESAVFSVSDSRLRTLFGEGFHGAEALLSLRQRQDTLQPSVRLLAVFLELTAVGLFVWAWTPLQGVRGVLTLLAGVLGIILFAELTPRAVASRWPIRMALSAAPLLLSAER